MDLMKNSTTYIKLKRNYQNFGAPTVRVLVNGVDIIRKLGAQLSDVSVELSVNSTASGCSFDVLNEYQHKNTDFSQTGSVKHLQIGAKVELELGYIKTVSVFYGLVVELDYVYDDDRAPYIHVECMDAKCLLMKQQHLSIFTDKSLTGAISELFGAQPFSSYIKGKQIESHKKKLNMLPIAMEDDYSFVKRAAAYMGYEFFIIQGKVYLRNPPTSSSSIMTIGRGKGLISAKLSLRGVGLFEKAEVVGIDSGNRESVTGSATVSGRFSKGNTSSQMMRQSAKTYFDPHITSNSEATTRAGVLMRNAKGSFCSLTCRCVGLPELCPGRNLRVEGIGGADLEYYITETRHTFDERGFFTTIEARRDSL